MSKKLEEKQQRRLAQERKERETKRAARRKNLVTLLVTLLVMGGVVALIVTERKKTSGPIGVPAADAGCEEIEEFDPSGSNEHIEVGAQHAPYNSDPPTSGPHYAAPDGPVDTGFYSQELASEAVVHNLEHGQIVLWYRPDASDESIEEIERIVKDESAATVAVPYSGVDSRYTLVMTAWARSQSCAKPSSEAVNAFRKEFQGRGLAPEASITKPYDG